MATITRRNPQIAIPAKAGTHRSAGKLLLALHDRLSRADMFEARDSMGPGLRRDGT
jgi:hypothetical protein